MSNFWISLQGRDTNAGDERNPWQTLVAAKRAKAGDTVTLLPGTWREPLPLVSGITVKAKEPGRSMLWGDAAVAPAWAKDARGIWHAAFSGQAYGVWLGIFETAGAFCTCYDGAYAKFDPTRPGGAVIPGSRSQWLQSGGDLALTTDGGNPKDEGVKIATGNIAITATGLSDVHLDGIATRYWRRAFEAIGGKNIVLTNCDFRYSATTAIGLGPVDGMELSGCTIYGAGSLLGHYEDVIHQEKGRLLVQGCDIGWGGHGLCFLYRGGEFTLRGNHLHDSGGSGITCAENVNGMVVQDNWISRCATQRSPSVRDVGAALQLHGDRHQIKNNHIEKCSKGVLMQAEGKSNPSSSDCLFDHNTLLDMEENGCEYQEITSDTGEKGRIQNNAWRDSVISGAGLDLLSLWYAGQSQANAGSSNTFQHCQIAHGRIRSSAGTFDTAEAARARLPGVYAGSQSDPIPGNGSTLTAPPVPSPTPPQPPDPPNPPIPPPTPVKPHLAALTPSSGAPLARVTATGSGFGVNPSVIYSNSDGGKRLEGLGGNDTSVSWTMPADVVTGEVHVRRIDTTPTQLSNPLTFTVTGSGGVNQPPVANAGGPYQAQVGSIVVFDGSGSTDPDGEVKAWQWKPGDGGNLPATGLPRHGYAYLTPGTYTVTLAVTDNQGATATATTIATITAAPPTSGLRVTLSASPNDQGASFSGTVRDGGALPAGTRFDVVVTSGGREGHTSYVLPGDVPPEPEPPPNTDVEAALIGAVNAARAANGGLAPLITNAKLTAAARAHTQWMADTKTLSHTGSGGSQMGDRLAAAGYRFVSAGENIASGFSTVESAMLAWMNSPGHRANILNAGFKDVGVARVVASDGRAYWTQDFGAPAAGMAMLRGPV